MEMFSGVLMLALLSGGQMGLPLGLPPLPEDPVLARIAPEECLAYYSWSGVAEPDPKSKNQTEQMLAEPEVKQFVAGVGRALSTAIKKGAPATPQGQMLGANGPKLIHILITHSTALFASKFDVAAGGTGIVGGVVVATGDETAKVKTSLEQIEKVLLAGAAHAADAKWHTLPAAQPGPPIEWGFRDKYLIIGVGKGSADAIADRMAGKPPAWLVALKKRLPVERVSTVLYVNVKSLLDAARTTGGADARQILDALGLANVRSVASVGGLETTGCIAKTWVQTDQAPSGLLSVFGPKPLKPADLAAIPKDASFAIAARLDPARLFDAVMKAGSDFTRSLLAQTNETLGFRLKEDLLDTLGDSWCIYNSPSEGGLLITGLTIVAPVKDHDRLQKTNDRLVELSKMSGLTAGPAVKTTTFRGQKIFFVNGVGNEFFPIPLPLAWCVSDTHLILSLSPQNIRAFLARDPATGSLADLLALAARLKSDQPVLISYQDTAEMLKIVYPIIQLIADADLPSLQEEGLDIDASLLPSLASIIRHVEPGVGILSLQNDGLVYVSRHSMPVGGGFPGLAALFFGFSVRERSTSVEPPLPATPAPLQQ